MPITKSAKKALRQSARRKVRNEVKKEAVRKVISSYRKALSTGKTEEAKRLLSAAYKLLDKAAKTGAVKPGAAARKKSRLAKLSQRSAKKAA